MRLRMVLIAMLCLIPAARVGGQTAAAGAPDRGAAEPTPVVAIVSDADDSAARPLDWQQTVRALADVLVSGEGAFGTILPAGTQVRRFDQSVPQDRLSLRQSTARGEIIFATGYKGIPATVASDFGTGIREAAFIPDAIGAQFTLGSDESVKRANATAGEWIAWTLQPNIDQPVGVIAIWREDPPTSSGGASRVQIIFVLVKGRPLHTGGYEVTQIVYGDTSQILK